MQMYRVHVSNRVLAAELEPAAEVRKPASDDENYLDVGHGRTWHVWQTVSIYIEWKIYRGAGNGVPLLP